MEFHLRAFITKLIFIFLLLTGASSCKRKAASPLLEKPDTSGIAAMKLTDLFTDSLAVESWLLANESDTDVIRSVRAFYYQRAYRFAWFTPAGPTERARAFLDKLRNSDSLSSTGSAFNWSVLTAGYDSLFTDWSPDADRPAPDLQLTALYFHFTRAEFEGLPEEDLRRLEWFIPRKKVDWVQLLDSSLAASSTSRPWQGPMFHQYQRLVRVLARYRAIRASGGWTPVGAGVLGMRKGDRDSCLLSLRLRLRQSGDLLDTLMSPVYDDSLSQAIRYFRSRHGLVDEGAIDSATWRLLNLPVDSGIRTLLVNLERCRWIPEDPVGARLIVNIPTFRLYVFSDTGYAWSTPVIVGKTGTATTIFTGKLRTLILNPTWTVPRKIVYEEIIPAVRANPDYLSKNRMDVLRPEDPTHPVNPRRIDWSVAGPGKFPYIVRQRSGKWNALGRYKFLFPNSYDIYLHDTPSKKLFERAERTFSHGCIRVSQPDQLAQFVLSGDSLWPQSRVASALAKGKERRVPLRRSIPVTIVYFTAWVDEEGVLQQREDVYGHDHRLAETLFRSTDRP